MWTPTELGSEARPAGGEAWRVVEHQYTVSTRKIVDTREEQELLEDILEETKPRFPPAAENLHYLLKTPFRYYPPSPYGSRFRRPLEGDGVFYCSEAIRTGLAECAYWRRRFIAASPETPWPRNQELLTVFSVGYRSQLRLDLTLPPLDRDRAKWIRPDDYVATQALAAAARRAEVDAIRYESVRDRGDGINIALLSPAVFSERGPRTQQTWYLYLGPVETNCVRAGRQESFTFVPDERP